MNLLHLSRSTVGQTVSSKDGSTYTFIPSYMLVLQWAWHCSQREVGSLFPPYEPEQGPVTASSTGVWQNATKYVALKPRPHERCNSPSLSPRLLGYLPLALSHHVWGNPAHIEGRVQWRCPGWQPQPAPSREQASSCHTVRVGDPSDDSSPQPWSFPVDAPDIVAQNPFYTWSEFLTTERVRTNTLYNAWLLCFKAPCFGVTFCSHSKSEILWRGKCVCYWFRKLSVTGGEELKCIVSYH